MLLLLLLCQLDPGQAATAYLVGTMEQPFTASNNSFNSLRSILKRLDTYDTIVLTEDYYITDPKQFQQTDPVRLPGNLLITSAPGGRYQLSFAFLVRGLQVAASRGTRFDGDERAAAFCDALIAVKPWRSWIHSEADYARI